MKNRIFFNLLFIATACTVQKRVCPAYQSAFIFDKNTRENHFSYYNNHFKEAMTVTASIGKSIEIPPKDTLWMLRSVGLDGPAIPFQKKVKRNKYLLLPKKSHRKALKLMRTVERKFVYEAYDSARMEKIHQLDSISLLDSVYRISEAREKFNLDQDAYMWYFKDQLLLPDARWEKFDKFVEEKKRAEETAKKNRKGWFSFLKRKKKLPEDTTAAKVLPEDFTIEQKTKAIEEEDYNADEQYDVDDELADSTAVGKPAGKKKDKNVKGGKRPKPKNASADQSKWSKKERRKKEKEEAEKRAAKEKAAEKKATEKAAEIDESLLREKETKKEPAEKEETAPADKPQDSVEEPSKKKE